MQVVDALIVKRKEVREEKGGAGREERAKTGKGREAAEHTKE
jgi:hypothetical protein